MIRRVTTADLADISGYTYTYLMNGTRAGGQLDRVVPPGEQVRLRFFAQR